jgi:hypothetical protein
VGELAVIGRRDFLASVGVGWFADQALPDRGPIAGSVLGASHRVGHLLRGTPPKADGPAERADIVIVGSGASGLNAAWRLQRAGVSALVLELEPFVGGTSTWGEDGVVPHPFGAHYLPVPERHARSVSIFLEHLGVITGWDAAGRPRLRAELLCHAPEERVYYRDRWYPGLVPIDALDPADRADMERFRDVQQKMLHWKGRDGRHAFAIPREHSSTDPDVLALDTMTMDAWLGDNGFTGDYVRWYTRYATLDDFGGELDDVSAWAGWHYFASRRMETEQTEGSRYLVWPQGNGWLIERLVADLPGEIRTRALVTSVAGDKSGVTVSYLDTERRTLHRVRARAVIVALPGFIAGRIVQGLTPPSRKASPWVVSNLHVRRPEEPNRAWDSVIVGSDSLGYVDAGHQLTTPMDRTVLTHFRAFGAADARGTRQRLLQRSWVDHASAALNDVATVHPEIVDQTDRIDVMVWGHAMPRPTPGFLGEKMPLWLGDRIAWAHVDQTGFALFEEASYRGMRAAEAVLDHLDVKRGSSYL